MTAPRLENFINGVYVPALDGRTSDLIDPATEEVFGTAALSSAADVDAAYQAAAAAAVEWNRSTPAARQLALTKLADAVERRAAEFADLESRETGKPRDTLEAWDIATAVRDLRFFAGACRVLEGRAGGEYLDGFTSYVRREPIGVVGQIAPWNFPLPMAVWKAGPALAAGNTVVLKPAESTPSTALLFAEIAAEFLPAGVLNVVLGDRATGEAVVDHATPGMVSLTGSVRAGRQVAEAAGRRLHRLHLELGGKAPAIVFPDADLADTAAPLAVAAFYHGGQDCTGATRMLVHESVYDAFVEQFLQAVGHIKTGGPHEKGVFYGALSTADQLATVEGFVARLPGHAKIRTGGKRLPRPGYFFPPTVVTDVRQDDEIVQNEVFGPVVTIQSFATDDEALALANGTAYGLAASVWTNDLNRAHRFTREISAGCVWVNTHLPLVSEMPQGGFNQSGYGKDMSVYSIEEYTRVKHVMTFHGGRTVTLEDLANQG
ncbi:gamma-aminobutyraldehyde dehydrogenase [Yinghuangia aomiensis]|uniref:Gamma-aminobutyraldehyde dehydrogenase n=1 Tax=Yinghuangia aomiensis TaxID=676205 RepID=A0ABP9GXD6_9ACTN